MTTSDLIHNESPGDRPLFTIAIPTFNRAQWLRGCVDAALSQTFGSFEVIVSDNASTDETAEVLGQLRDPRLRVIRQTRNIGPIPNWNACLDAAHGTYLVILCDDDHVAPHLLERCGSLLNEARDVQVVVALGDVIEPQTHFRKSAVRSRRLGTGIWDGPEILLEFLLGRITPQLCTVAMRTDTLRARGGFPDGWPHAGDLVSWVPMLLLGRAGLVNESCGSYCSHDGTQTANFSFETRFRDLDRLATTIVQEAEQKVADPVALLEIKARAGRYVARNCIGHLASERRKGVSRRDVLSAGWAWRRRIAGIRLADLSMLARPLALFLTPLSIIRLLSTIKAEGRRIREQSRAHTSGSDVASVVTR